MLAVATAIRCFALVELPVELGVEAIGIDGVGGGRNASDDRRGDKQGYDDLHGSFSTFVRDADGTMSSVAWPIRSAAGGCGCPASTPIHCNLFRTAPYNCLYGAWHR
jgi:hypothetical protein